MPDRSADRLLRLLHDRAQLGGPHLRHARHRLRLRGHRAARHASGCMSSFALPLAGHPAHRLRGRLRRRRSLAHGAPESSTRWTPEAAADALGILLLCGSGASIVFVAALAVAGEVLIAAGMRQTSAISTRSAHAAVCSAPSALCSPTPVRHRRSLHGAQLLRHAVRAQHRGALARRRRPSPRSPTSATPSPQSSSCAKKWTSAAGWRQRLSPSA